MGKRIKWFTANDVELINEGKHDYTKLFQQGQSKDSDDGALS